MNQEFFKNAKQFKGGLVLGKKSIANVGDYYLIIVPNIFNGFSPVVVTVNLLGTTFMIMNTYNLL